MFKVRLVEGGEFLTATMVKRETTCAGPGHKGVIVGSLRSAYPVALVVRVPHVGRRTFCTDCVIDLTFVGDTPKETTT